jgi:oligopeptide/dipeptide ABC transporter ATP-binding protein
VSSSRPVVLEVRGLSVRGPRGQAILDDVDITLRAGGVTALVGETGSGKTTVLNSVLGLLPAGLAVSAGEVRLEDEENESIDLLTLSEHQRRRYLGVQIGYVPQDVRSGLNPLMTARASVREAAQRGNGPARDRADAAMVRAGLTDDFVRRDADRRPGKLSGGQCQRVLIAQAIVNQPRVLLLDEPTASLDPPARREVQATVRQLAGDHCAICLVTHDVTALPGLADTVGVMYLGRIVEMGPAQEVLRHPRHPYTIGLLGCVLRLDQRTRALPIPGEPPPSAAEEPGCKFHPRCQQCEPRCRSDEPRLREISLTRKVACHVVEPASH